MAADPIALLQEALASTDAASLENAVRGLDAHQATQPYAFYAKAELARRQGDLARAGALSTTAVSALFNHKLASAEGRLSIPALLDACLGMAPAQLHAGFAYFNQLGEVLEQAGTLHGLAPLLPPLAARLAARPRGTTASMHVATVFALLGFHDHCDAAWSERVLADVALPWLQAVAQQGDFEAAIAVENRIYASYVKRRESQAWFKAATARWIPLLAQAARRHRPPEATRHRLWREEPVRRVGFFLHNATMLAHIVVLIETLRAVHAVGARNYEFTVFVLGGRHPGMHDALTACGVRVRYLEEGRPQSPFFERLVALEDELRAGNFAAIFWVSLVTMMAIAFPRRIAPLQGWFAMKYHACEIDEIDVRLAVENVVLRKSMEGHEWRTLGSAAPSWVDAAKAAPARALRATFPADAVVAASIGREEKLDSPEFLAAVCELLRAHPNLRFLWTGRVPRASIQGAFERAGVADRARFVGWVDTKLYAQAIDLFLDSFPFPCGFTLKEAMAAGKPVVMMRTPESLETGVPGAISPLVEHTGAAPAEARERLRAIFTGERDFDLYLCAGSPAEYTAIASRLIGDAALRARAGAANRAFIEAFLSSPADEARKLLDHLDELFETLPRQPSP